MDANGSAAEYMPGSDQKIYRSPLRHHIPVEEDVAACAKHFPWRAVGYRIILMMMSGEDRISEGGVILPDVYQSQGKDKQRTIGIVVAHGPGEIVPHGGYVSVRYDFGIRLGDVVFIEPNCGHVITDEEQEYRVITPHEVIMAQRADVGKKVREKLLAKAGQVMARYEKQREHAGEAFARNPVAQMPERPSYEAEAEEYVEGLKEQRGKGQKTQVVVPKKKWESE